MEQTRPTAPLKSFTLRRAKRNQWERLGRLLEHCGETGVPTEVRFDQAGITLWRPGKVGITISWGSERECIDGKWRFVR